MKTPNRAYIILLSGISVAIIVLCVLLYLVLGAIQQGSLDVAAEKQEVVSMQLQDKQVSDFKAKYQGYKENLDKAGQLFVDAENPVDFIQFLEGVAVNTNVNADITVGGAKTLDAAQKPITFQIDITGSFRGILQFSQQLEMSPYLVNVTNVTIRKIEKSVLSKNVPQGDLEAFISLEALPK